MAAGPEGEYSEGEPGQAGSEGGAGGEGVDTGHASDECEVWIIVPGEHGPLLQKATIHRDAWVERGIETPTFEAFRAIKNVDVKLI